VSKWKDVLEKVVFLDTETTNKDKFLAEIIELGAVIPTNNSIATINHLYTASEPIDAEISSVTHITNKMVEGKPLFSVDDINPILNYIDEIDGAAIAHNSAYDSVVINKYSGIHQMKSPWICTMRFAKQLFIGDPSVKNYKLVYLRYRFDLDIPEELEHHRATSDCYITMKLFEFLLDEAERQGYITHGEEDLVKKIVELCNRPMFLPSIPFGKHASESWDNIPASYLKWALQNVSALDENDPLYDPDLCYTFEIVVNKLVDEGKF
jgi:DNA polymerase III epsilon subunit-like protein